MERLPGLSGEEEILGWVGNGDQYPWEEEIGAGM